MALNSRQNQFNSSQMLLSKQISMFVTDVGGGWVGGWRVGAKKLFGSDTDRIERPFVVRYSRNIQVQMIMFKLFLFCFLDFGVFN